MSDVEPCDTCAPNGIPTAARLAIGACDKCTDKQMSDAMYLLGHAFKERQINAALRPFAKLCAVRERLLSEMQGICAGMECRREFIGNSLEDENWRFIARINGKVYGASIIVRERDIHSDEFFCDAMTKAHEWAAKLKEISISL